MRSETSEKLFRAAAEVIPGGVNSPVRAWKAVGGQARFIQRAAGSTVTDADGNTYVDYVGSWGPMILGHAHRSVLQAVQNALREGTSFGAPTAREVDMARRIVATFPSIDMVRLVSSGTEATMTALRVARGYTERAVIVKFAGCYHGHVDSLLVRAGSGALTLGAPDSAGVSPAAVGETRIAAYNDLDSVRALFSAEGPDIAAVIVEPVPGNMGVINPEPGFLEGLRAITREHGALLIFDEVMSGFRVAYGGVQTQVSIEPDLTCLGKVVGGGLPLAAVGGRRDIMQVLAPLGTVYQAGTLSGNPLAVAAGIATLERLSEGRVYDQLEASAARLESGLRAALRDAGERQTALNRRGSMLTLFFGVDAVTDFDSACRCDTQRYARFFQAMLEHGVYLPPSAFEAWFVSLAHSEDDIDRTIEAAAASLQETG
jgi:glutamate-1-semialdehyde 2,1-aminomutase